jgi:3-polyprenyl-4-hydroxybenzoate decarboxylase
MNEPRWVLTRHARIAEHEQTLTVFGKAEVRKFDGDSAAVARAVLELLRQPRSREELLTGLEANFEGVRQRPDLLDQLLKHLIASDAVGPHVTGAPVARPLAGSRVLVAATGAVASAFTPVLVGQLQRLGAEVRVVLTRSARRFVSARSLEALTHHPVGASLWSGTPDAPAPHIALADWADLVLVAPASATTLSRLVRGDCSDLVSAVAIATRAAVVLAPSMNPGMLTAPSVRRNLEQLVEDGFHVVWPSSGFEVAERPDARTPLTGPMLPAEELVAIVQALIPRRAPTPRPDATFWDHLYAHHASQLPWHSATLDPDLAAALKQGRGRLLDLGCGLGTVAVAAAKLGYQVTATDVSPVALDAARKAAGELPIQFVADDFLSSKLEGPFDVVVYRALLHTIPPASHDRYVRNLARLLEPGARLVLKVHSNPEETRRLATTCFDVPRLTALLAPELQVESCLESSLPGSIEPAPRALCVVARRS